MLDYRSVHSPFLVQMSTAIEVFIEALAEGIEGLNAMMKRRKKVRQASQEPSPRNEDQDLDDKTENRE